MPIEIPVNLIQYKIFEYSQTKMLVIDMEFVYPIESVLHLNRPIIIFSHSLSLYLSMLNVLLED